MSHKRKDEEESSIKESHKKHKHEPESVTKEVEAPSGRKHEHEFGGHILERGHIYFFYRPKVGLERAENMDDVQKMYILLNPLESDEKESKKRLLVVAKKKLPSSKKHEKFFAFVDQVATDVDELKKTLGEIQYETKTKGERVLEACRPLGEGYYAIVSHEKHEHTHLVYVLELPKEIGSVQKAFNIKEEGSMLVTVKSPTAGTKEGAIVMESHFPEHLMKKFDGKKYHSLNPPSFLNYEKAQIIMIGASDDLQAEFGKLGKEIEKEERKDAKHMKPDELYKELHLSKNKFPPQPLFSGSFI